MPRRQPPRRGKIPPVPRRLPHLTFNLAAAVSLLVTAVALVGAVRSQYATAYWLCASTVKMPGGARAIADYVLTSDEGSVEVGLICPPMESQPQPGLRHWKL